MLTYAVYHIETKEVIAIDLVEHKMIGNDRVQVDVPDPQALIGKRFTGVYDPNQVYDETAFEHIPVELLAIALDQDVVTVNTTVTATAQVTKDGVIDTDVNGTYYIPVIRNADNWQGRLLEVIFVNGEATASFSLPEAGIYTLDLTKIYPAPTAKLIENPILIIKDG